MSSRAVPEDVQARLKKVEEELARLKKPPRDWLEVLKAFAPIISGMAVVVVGYLLTGSVNNALQRQQLDLSNIREMRELLLKLGDPQATREDVRTTAVTLSAFGGRAVAPLINLLQGGGETRVVAAQEALRAIGMTDHEAVCSQLAKVAGNRTRLFRWEAHLWAIRLLGELDCVEARHTIEDYARLLRESRTHRNLALYARAVQPDPAPTPRALEQLQNAVDESLQLLGRQSPPAARR